MSNSGLIFLGPPGAGKGTQSQVLADTFQIPHISTGDILRQSIANQTPLGQKAKAYVDQGELVPDELILDLIRDRLTQSDTQVGWILDGFPRNVNQARFLDALLAEIDHHVDGALNLEVPEQSLVDRLLQRGRQDDNEETIRRRLQVYHEQTAPVIAYYQEKDNLYSVNGNLPPEEVTQAISQIISTHLNFNNTEAKT